MDTIINKIRKDFPTLVKSDEGVSKIFYLDNAATTFKPQVVLDKLLEYYIDYPSNIHRGVYDFSTKASDEYNKARHKIASFLGINHPECLIFTSGTTASSNLFSFSFVDTFLKTGDEIIISPLEHHSNLVNWIFLSKKVGFNLKYIPLNPKTLQLEIETLPSLITSKTKLITLTHISNTLGVINPIEKITAIAHQHNIPVSIDIAQSVAHVPIDLEALGVDFAFFSGHKIFAPTGIGCFYGKKQYLSQMHPFFFGGGMISSVSLYDFTIQNLPESYEAGTPPIAEAIALGAAIDYINSIGGFTTIQSIEEYLYQEISKVILDNPNIETLLPSPHSVPIFSFNLKGIHPHDAASILNEYKIAVRTGKHCTEPLLDFLNTNSTIRASLSFYNNKEDIKALEMGLQKTWEILNGY